MSSPLPAGLKKKGIQPPSPHAAPETQQAILEQEAGAIMKKSLVADQEETRETTGEVQQQPQQQGEKKEADDDNDEFFTSKEHVRLLEDFGSKLLKAMHTALTKHAGSLQRLEEQRTAEMLAQLEEQQQEERSHSKRSQSGAGGDDDDRAAVSSSTRSEEGAASTILGAGRTDSKMQQQQPRAGVSQQQQEMVLFPPILPKSSLYERPDYSAIRTTSSTKNADDADDDDNNGESNRDGSLLRQQEQQEPAPRPVARLPPLFMHRLVKASDFVTSNKVDRPSLQALRERKKEQMQQRSIRDEIDQFAVVHGGDGRSYAAGGSGSGLMVHGGRGVGDVSFINQNNTLAASGGVRLAASGSGVVPAALFELPSKKELRELRVLSYCLREATTKLSGLVNRDKQHALQRTRKTATGARAAMRESKLVEDMLLVSSAKSVLQHLEGNISKFRQKRRRARLVAASMPQDLLKQLGDIEESVRPLVHTVAALSTVVPTTETKQEEEEDQQKHQEQPSADKALNSDVVTVSSDGKLAPGDDDATGMMTTGGDEQQQKEAQQRFSSSSSSFTPTQLDNNTSFSNVDAHQQQHAEDEYDDALVSSQERKALDRHALPTSASLKNNALQQQEHESLNEQQQHQDELLSPTTMRKKKRAHFAPSVDGDLPSEATAAGGGGGGDGDDDTLLPPPPTGDDQATIVMRVHGEAGEEEAADVAASTSSPTTNTKTQRVNVAELLARAKATLDENARRVAESEANEQQEQQEGEQQETEDSAAKQKKGDDDGAPPRDTAAENAADAIDASAQRKRRKQPGDALDIKRRSGGDVHLQAMGAGSGGAMTRSSTQEKKSSRSYDLSRQQNRLRRKKEDDEDKVQLISDYDAEMIRAAQEKWSPKNHEKFEKLRRLPSALIRYSAAERDADLTTVQKIGESLAHNVQRAKTELVGVNQENNLQADVYVFFCCCCTKHLI